MKNFFLLVFIKSWIISKLNMFSFVNISVYNSYKILNSCFRKLRILLSYNFCIISIRESKKPCLFKLFPCFREMSYKLSVKETNIIHAIMTNQRDLWFYHQFNYSTEPEFRIINFLLFFFFHELKWHLIKIHWVFFWIFNFRFFSHSKIALLFDINFIWSILSKNLKTLKVSSKSVDFIFKLFVVCHIRISY